MIKGVNFTIDDEFLVRDQSMDTLNRYIDNAKRQLADDILRDIENKGLLKIVDHHNPATRNTTVTVRFEGDIYPRDHNVAVFKEPPLTNEVRNNLLIKDIMRWFGD